MIGLSIVALTVVLSVPEASPVRPVTVTPASAEMIGFPSISMPHIPMPKFRMPRLPKRNTADAPIEVVSRRLTAMVREQESWFAEHGRYGTHPTHVAAAPGEEIDRVQVQVLYAGKKGWTAMASHPDAPGKNCVIYVGNRGSLPMIPRTRADATDASAEALPACDR